MEPTLPIVINVAPTHSMSTAKYVANQKQQAQPTQNIIFDRDLSCISESDTVSSVGYMYLMNLINA